VHTTSEQDLRGKSVTMSKRTAIHLGAGDIGSAVVGFAPTAAAHIASADIASAGLPIAAGASPR
jgi:hypothetical protein